MTLSVVAFIIVALVGQNYILHNQISTLLDDSIISATQDGNTTATKLFINEIYPRLKQNMDLETTDPNGVKALQGDQLQATDQTIRQFMLGTDILKIKIYSNKGLTVYSSDHSQIGEDKSANQGFLSALQGVPGSQITHRGKFSALEGDVFERDLVASYIPIRNAMGLVIGVGELYTDRTPAMAKTNRQLNEVVSTMVLSGAVTLLLIFVLIWSFQMKINRMALSQTDEN